MRRNELAIAPALPIFRRMDARVSRLRFIPFEVPTAVSEPPEGDDWIHEVKFDGYRTQLVIDKGKVTAFSRRGLDWSDRYPGVIAAAKDLPVKSAILDGETVIMDKDGVSDFSALIKAVHKKSEAIAFVAFDLLHMDGIDLRKEPLIRRRDLLRELIPDDGSIQFSDHFVASGKEIFEAVKKLGLEGIVSKRAKAPYRSGPSRNWLKTKNYAEVELPILGVVQEAGKPILALLGNTRKTGPISARRRWSSTSSTAICSGRRLQCSPTRARSGPTKTCAG